MTLSIIIVNYNVKYFLEQCLYSIYKSSLQHFEVIVIDNNSTDGSMEFLEPLFLQVQFIKNKHNPGFAKACNQGVETATGKYILFLNPDTLLAEDTLSTCVSFFEKMPAAGALGVQMLDGSGAFLKESKRSFPAPLTAFFKLAGLAKAFPRSPFFSRYHLGHLPQYKNNEVDVLAGAFMMIPKKVLERTGSFDETFFMYGEDVDLSYRIQKAGYKNYYVADAAIIHFKGESTKRGSLNYVRLFYSAMSLFVQKHYGGAKANVFNTFIHVAIWLRAAASAAAKFIKWSRLPVIDAALILFSFWLVKEVWIKYIRTDIIYSNQLFLILFPAFTVVYLAVAYYAGLYNKIYRKTNLMRSTGIATLVLLSGYSLLPETYRFSRGILAFGALLSFAFITVLRSVLIKTGLLQQPIENNVQPYLLIAGTIEEFGEIKNLLAAAGKEKNIIGRIAVTNDLQGALAHIDAVCATADALAAKELIICTGALSYKKTIALIKDLNRCVRVRFHAADSSSIVGSDSGKGNGEVLSEQTPFNLNEPHYRRLKRLIDVGISVSFLIFFPVHFFFVKKPMLFIKACVQVLIAKKTWIGYSGYQTALPHLRKGIIAANGLSKNEAQALPESAVYLIDHWYAKNYTPLQDIKTIFKNYRKLDG